MGDNALIIVAPTVPTPDPYDPASISLDGWMQVFDEFCRLSNIEAEPVAVGLAPVPVNNRRSWFLKSIGLRNFEVLRIACLPDLPNTKTIPFLIQKLRERFEAPRLVPVMRMEFNARLQNAKESIHQYLSALQDLASKCDYRNNLDEMLRDQLIRGIRSDECRRRLLGEADLTFANAKAIVIQDETVRKQAQALANAVHVNRVDKPYNQKQHPQGQGQPSGGRSEGQSKEFGPCFRCGRRHNHNTCAVKSWKCFKCSKLGHLRKKCPEQNDNAVNAEEPGNRVPEDSEEAEVHNLFNIRTFC